ncbi:hypothetical protein [Pseudomonas putida]|uniref:hypothetical protein n=1 Tax=Pseudomonas putida TaxID=303 RepID=UPI0013B4009E|nr:hypothetical protein [Pseudomonas putida]MCI1038000.1 hypothetical protein [Pseudomonas putida]WQE52163.1 hypothetical protein U0028_20100 [Pseudomonas putida]GLO03520.1 hypothetical protein PPUJ13061_34190 [Pseudomonas putida]HDS1005937.1 hypothetical protein [Pseudomonas putida]
MSSLYYPIKKLLSRASANQVNIVPVAVVPMTQKLVAAWHDKVQPLIDANYQHWSATAPGNLIRADKGWNWHKNFLLLALHNTLYAGDKKAHSEGVAMCIVVRSFNGSEEFPIGMLTTVPKLQSNIHGVVRRRGLTWYLSDAPEEVYTQILQIPPIQSVAKALLDCSIQTALDEGEDGSLVLKADDAGGTKLESFYKRCGMNNLPKGHPPVTPFFRRSKPERYYHFLAHEAQAYAAIYNPMR